MPPTDLDVIELDPPHATIGIAATGTTFDSVRQALSDLGVDDSALHHAGIRLLRIGMPTPLGPDTSERSPTGSRRLLVVEDKTAFVETQVREILYGRAGASADPRQEGRGGSVAHPRRWRTHRRTSAGAAAPRAAMAVLELKKPPPPALSLEVLPAQRAAYFCSGCPHNRSTAMPEGSMAGGGIGCHTMVTMSGRTGQRRHRSDPDGRGGQPVDRPGPVHRRPHLFQNIGDGTFFHSGQLAVQACVAAGVNITYKLLYNEVVAMTGAQDAEGALTVAKLTHKLIAEGVKQIIICADEPQRHNKRALAKGTITLAPRPPRRSAEDDCATSRA